MISYFDASALAKRYIQEEHSQAVNRLLAKGPFATSRISEAELASALSRRHREGFLSEEQRDRLIEALAQDIASFNVVELTPEVSALACRLLKDHPLRAADALHLASAILVAAKAEVRMRFVSFDKDLNKAARLEKLDLPSFGRRS